MARSFHPKNTEGYPRASSVLEMTSGMSEVHASVELVPPRVEAPGLPRYSGSDARRTLGDKSLGYTLNRRGLTMKAMEGGHALC